MAHEHVPSLEIHVPISPTPTFLTMLHCLTLSLRRFGGRYAGARVVATVGDAAIDGGLAARLPWLARHDVEIRWLPEARYREDSYYATAVDRCRYDFAADVVLLLDADVLVAGPLDDLVELAWREQALGGLIAHVSPFTEGGRWPALFAHCGLGAPRATYQHTGWGAMSTDEALRHCPAYFNLGVLCAPRTLFARIGDEIIALMHRVNAFALTPYRCQLALALAVAKLALPHRALPMRYNFANDPRLESLHAAELPPARILHLLRDHQQVNKWELFAAVERIDAFLRRRDVSGVNARAQEVLAAVFPTLVADHLEAAR